MESKIKVPTETVSLPSKGLIYPSTSLLSKGEIEMKYMTAREEDILTNINFLRDGVAIDKLLQSLVVTPIDFDELIIGDKNAIMIAARILGYGKDYSFKYNDPKIKIQRLATVDLTQLKEKELDPNVTKGVNEFTFTLPKTENVVTFKILTHGDEKKITAELKGLAKLNPTANYGVTVRLKHMITSINGNRDKNEIGSFVNQMIVTDARALRKEYDRISPDIELKFYPDDDYTGEGIEVPIGVEFFWPDAGIEI